MTNEEIRARMWEAYKAGMREGSDLVHVENPFHREQFLRWLADPEHFPELMGDGCNGEPIKEHPKVYYHNFGCEADHHTPNGEGVCTCDGSGDPTLGREWAGDGRTHDSL